MLGEKSQVEAYAQEANLSDEDFGEALSRSFRFE